MNLIFLDADGVLNTNIVDEWINHLDHRNWKISSVSLIDELCHEYDLKVVISSSWRKLYPEISWWNDEFKAMGFDNIDVIGITPSAFNGFRGREIRQYIEGNSVDKYVIIDDDSDFYRDQPRICCDPSLGFTRNDYYKARDILDGLIDGTDNPCIIEIRRNEPIRPEDVF